MIQVLVVVFIDFIIEERGNKNVYKLERGFWYYVLLLFFIDDDLYCVLNNRYYRGRVKRN